MCNSSQTTKLKTMAYSTAILMMEIFWLIFELLKKGLNPMAIPNCSINISNLPNLTFLTITTAINDNGIYWPNNWSLGDLRPAREVCQDTISFDLDTHATPKGLLEFTIPCGDLNPTSVAVVRRKRVKETGSTPRVVAEVGALFTCSKRYRTRFVNVDGCIFFSKSELQQRLMASRTSSKNAGLRYYNYFDIFPTRSAWQR